MRPKLIIPALLIAAVLPFFLLDREWPRKLQQSLSATPAQISGSSGHSNSPTPSYEFNAGPRESPPSSAPSWSSPSSPSTSGTSSGSPSGTGHGSHGYSSPGYSDRTTKSTPATSASGTGSTSGSGQSGFGSSTTNAYGTSASVATNDGSVEGPPVQQLTEVFRFDVTPRWVTGRWPRVSTVLSESNLEGLRVPLVTGKAPDDAAGSLTYYFDKQHVVQRLTFHGTTGDDTRIVALATQTFGLKPMPTLGAGLYLLSWGGTPRSAMRINLAPVVRSAEIHRQLEVALEINRPRSYYGMSPEFEKLLEHDRSNARW